MLQQHVEVHLILLELDQQHRPQPTQQVVRTRHTATAAAAAAAAAAAGAAARGGAAAAKEGGRHRRPRDNRVVRRSGHRAMAPRNLLKVRLGDAKQHRVRRRGRRDHGGDGVVKQQAELVEGAAHTQLAHRGAVLVVLVALARRHDEKRTRRLPFAADDLARLGRLQPRKPRRLLELGLVERVEDRAERLGLAHEQHADRRVVQRGLQPRVDLEEALQRAPAHNNEEGALRREHVVLARRLVEHERSDAEELAKV